MKKVISLLILISMALMCAAPLFAATAPTTTPLAPQPDSKVPKNFEPYDQRVKEYNDKGQLVKMNPLQQHRDSRRNIHIRI